MRLLDGTKLVDAAPDWRGVWPREGASIIVDAGSGDGRFAYERARADPDSLYVALDPDADSLAQYAFRAGRKPARGGVPNVRFVVASLEDLPPELAGSAAKAYVNFPWGALLRGVLRPEAPILEALAALLAPAGQFELVLCFDPQHDAAVLAGEALRLDEDRIDNVLTPAYRAAGLEIVERQRLSREEALAIPSSWGRRLLHGRSRDVFRVSGRRSPGGGDDNRGPSIEPDS